MRPVRRARYAPATSAIQSRVSGLPSHLPEAWPVSRFSQTEMALVAQFYSNEIAAFLPDTVLCLHLHQPLENYTPDGAPGELSPMVLALPPSAPLNVRPDGIANPYILTRDVEWVNDVEPDWIDVDAHGENVGLYLDTKFGGAAPDEVLFSRASSWESLRNAQRDSISGVPSLVLIRRAGENHLVVHSGEEPR